MNICIAFYFYLAYSVWKTENQRINVTGLYGRYFSFLTSGRFSGLFFSSFTGHKKSGFGAHALDDWKNEFLHIIDNRITILLNTNTIGTNSNLVIEKKKMGKLHSKYIFDHNLKKDTKLRFWKMNWILRIHINICTCSVGHKRTSFTSYRYSHENRC